MKKYIFTLLISYSISGLSSKSFLKFDPVQTSVFIDPTNLVCKSRFFIEFLPFYIQNTNKSEISEYFLPFNCNLLTSEDNATNVLKDVAAIHLNINHADNNFESVTNFCPKYQNVGFLIHINSFFKCRYWIDLILPISEVKNNMNLQETILNLGGDTTTTFVSDVTEAFKQSSWNYGKIDGTRSKKGLNDIDFKFGTHTSIQFFYEKSLSMTGHSSRVSDEAMRRRTYREMSIFPFIGCIIPTGNKTNSKYLFEPMIGNTKHFAFQGGLINFLELAPCITFYFDLNLIYQFKNSQKRMLDLIDKSWSRYMIVYESPEAALIASNNSGQPQNGDKGSPGINSFTQEVYVSPGFTFQSTGRLWFIKNCLKNEFGISVYFRESEKLYLRCREKLGNIALVGAAGSGTTTNARTINYNYLGTTINNTEDDKIMDNEYASVSASDFNLDSGSAPCALSLTFFYKFQYLYKNYKFNLATSYKSSRSNASPNLFAFWGGLTYEF